MGDGIDAAAGGQGADRQGAGGPSAADLPIVIVTRFAYVGQSGWKAAASRDPALLFDPARLRQRLALLRAINLASLAAQGDQRFHHFILTSDALPDWAMQDLQAACRAVYGDAGRFTIAARPPGRARKHLRHFLAGHCRTGPLVQVVLDDDDGLAANYIATLRGVLAGMHADSPDLLAELPKFVSFPLGYALSLRGEAGAGADEADVGEAGMGEAGAALYLHSYPHINLGLEQIDDAGGKNILAIHHQDAPRRFGCRLVRDQPMFVRTLHGYNDSRVAPGDRWTPVADWTQDAVVRRFFPGLLAPDAPWRQ